MVNSVSFSSVQHIAQAIRAKEISAQEVVTAYLARIEATKAQINAVIQLAPGAMAEARQADADLAQGIIRGPLHGVPFTVKNLLLALRSISY